MATRWSLTSRPWSSSTSSWSSPERSTLRWPVRRGQERSAVDQEGRCNIVDDRIGFVGLGIMGRGMAANLLRSQVAVTVYNRTAERTAPLVDLGAAAGETPRAVAERSDVVFVCVSDTGDV